MDQKARQRGRSQPVDPGGFGQRVKAKLREPYVHLPVA